MAERSMLVFTGSRKSRLHGLKALRDKLGRQIDDCESNRDLSSLSSRMMEVLNLIHAIEGEDEGTRGTVEVKAPPATGVSDIGAKRAQRLKSRKEA